MLLKRLAYQLFHPVLRRARCSPVLIRGLFGLRTPAGADVNFDPTTVLLARAAAELATTEDRSALEMGIGPGALVSLSLGSRRRQAGGEIKLTGCDCVARRVESAQRFAKHNSLEANFYQSDLFTAVPKGDPFDLILFNPPYVPTDVGEQLNMGTKLTDERTMWDGGDDGLSVLRQFLSDAPPYLSGRGRLLFGVQHVFVSDAAVRKVIEDSPFDLQRTYDRRSIPAAVYVLALPKDRGDR